MKGSRYFEKARQLLEQAKERKWSDEERREAAIELAGLMLREARRVQTAAEYRVQTNLGGMMDDSLGKVFTTRVTDECFRSNNSARVADQMIYLINKFGIPKYLSYMRKLELLGFKMLGKVVPQILVPMARSAIRKETKRVILPGEKRALAKHMKMRRKEGVRVNLNHLGEAILGEKEAEKRLQIYLEDLKKPEVEYISVKISTICSQINLLGYQETLKLLQERLKMLYRAAMEHTFVRASGKKVPKFVNLDMEEYRDLHLTVDLFRGVLDEQEFFRYSAGIVLQAYLPDSYLMQQKLTVWAMERVANGGAPIKIRIVKGANLAMEKVEASIKIWPQAPYRTKSEVDANFKRMLRYAMAPEHAAAARIGVGSHNLFDIAYAMLLRTENKVEDCIEFEMLEGMADHTRRVVQELSGGMLLYCPAATKEEFQNAVAYLVRRLDENTAPENFLRHLFKLIPGTREWQNQAKQFSAACNPSGMLAAGPRRTQNRFFEQEQPDSAAPFSNEPDTDWSLPMNQKWVQNIIAVWSKKEFEDVPLVIGGVEIPPVNDIGIGKDPSCPGIELYRYALADGALIEKSLQTAGKAGHKWRGVSVEEKSQILAAVAHLFRKKRGELIAVMVADSGKTAAEADVEISEAIDFIEYYRKNREKLEKMEDIRWEAKGTVLVAPPWNFPCSIPIGGIVSGLLAGNAVIFKPPRETVYVGWEIAKIFWEGGIGKDLLQFVVCEDDPWGSRLIQDPRISTVVLTGATSTAKLMLKLRPGLDLIAETGGKNALIITALSDRDLAIKDLVHSAFGHSGQKCSACSLAICEAEVYDDPHFRETLKDAAASLKVGSAWDFSTKVNPLIREPGEELLRALTTLEQGEEWLLEPKQDPKNPQLWSLGIKLGVKEGSFTHQTELFGPVLGVMRADNLEHAVKLANGTLYGLTSGIHALDQREQQYWIENIEAGNCYINRGITGAIVQRQPFGGCKESSFGPGVKAGGPNFLMQLMNPVQSGMPKKQEAASSLVNMLTQQLYKMGLSPEQIELWNASVGSYAFYWNHYFSKEHDPSLVLGQDNILKYVPRHKVVLRVQPQDNMFEMMRVIAAAATCGTPLEVSGAGEVLRGSDQIVFKEESEEAFIERVLAGEIKRVRFLSAPSLKLLEPLAEKGCNTVVAAPLANGRVELLRYLREVSLSIDYHRYGNLGTREEETRTPII